MTILNWHTAQYVLLQYAALSAIQTTEKYRKTSSNEQQQPNLPSYVVECQHLKP